MDYFSKTLTASEIADINDLCECERRNDHPRPLTPSEIKQIRLGYLRPVLAQYRAATELGREYAMMEALDAIRKALGRKD